MPSSTKRRIKPQTNYKKTASGHKTQSLTHFALDLNKNQIFTGNENYPTFLAYANKNEYLAIRENFGARLVLETQIHNFTIHESKFKKIF